MTDHLIDPSTIKVGQRAKFQCPQCSFAFFHYWTSTDAWIESHCYLHTPKVTMYITAVEDIPPNL